ncbi:MAG: helix-turn-helix transcriptional regulator [Pseudonocardia sp.]|jgi:PadR family transcriptional regulator, regulatory protein PadR
MTWPTQLVLRVLLVDPDRAVYGSEVAARAQLAPSTVHPVLARLEGLGWLVSAWEDADPRRLGRPRRRYYRLTEAGTAAAAAAVARVRLPMALLGDSIVAR